MNRVPWSQRMGRYYLVDPRGGLETPLVLPEGGSATQGAREMSPAWSPDGRWIAYLSDQSGEYEIYLKPQAGGEARRLTRDGGVWRFAPVWSPDSKRLAFGDRRQRLRILEVASGAVTEVDRGQREDLDYYAWSPDSRWLVYEKSRPNRIPGIAAYSLDQQRVVWLGDDISADSRPVFSADGKHLLFLSNRDYQPTFSAFEFNYLYTDAGRVYVAPLSPEIPALFPPKSDEEKGEEKDASAAGKGKEEPRGAEPKPPEPVRIVADGIAARTTAVPGIKPGQCRSPSATAEALLYLRGTDDESTLYRYDLKERKEEKVLEGVATYALSGDGKKLLYRVKTDWFVAEAKAGLKAGEGKLDLSSLVVKLDPVAEWRQMYKAGKPVVLDVADGATGAGRRQVTVRPVASEQGLFYLDWVRSRMQLVDRLSGGKVGYIHLPNTSSEGNRMLQKLFYAQAGKPALIVDDRYNGGGFIPDRMIEHFTRRTLSYWARRGIEGFRGRWVVENEGVSPDIEVVDLPEARIAGGDPSSEEAVEVLLHELAKKPTGPVTPPAPPKQGRVD